MHRTVDMPVHQDPHQIGTHSGTRGVVPPIIRLSRVGLQIEQLTIEPESPLIGKPLSSIEVRGHGAFVIFALKRSDGEVISKPEPGTLIVPGDSLIVIGRSGETPAFVDRTVTKKEIRYRGGVVTQRTTRG